MSNLSYIPVRSSQLRYYIRVPLYHEPAPGVFQLYKPPGLEISELRISEGMHPRLHIQQRDRMTAAMEVHKGFNVEIARSIDTGDVSAVKSTPLFSPLRPNPPWCRCCCKRPVSS